MDESTEPAEMPEIPPPNMAGWWFQPTPLNNDGVRKCWDDDIPFPMDT